MKNTDIDKLGKLVTEAQQIVVVGPDHIDGDSLSSMLALEEILGDLDKQVTLYSAGRVEDYLKYLEGWDRVSDELPATFDLAITPDLGAPSGAPRMLELHHRTLHTRPWVILDHHLDRTSIEGAALEIADTSAASTTELIHIIATQLKWPLNRRACRYLVSGIYADTLNLTTPSVTPATVRAFSDLVTKGDLQVSQLHAAYREMTAFDADLIPLKGRLLQTIEFYNDGQIAIIVVPGSVLAEFRDRVAPSALLFPDIQWARGVKVAALIYDYPNVKRTLLRSRLPIAGPIATEFGGGGHPMAAAFPTEGKTAEEIKKELIRALEKALQEHHEAN